MLETITALDNCLLNRRLLVFLAPPVGVSNDGTVGCICLCLHLVCKIMPYLTKFDGVERAPIRYTSQDKESGPFLKAGPNLLTNLIRLVVPTGFIYKLPGLSLSK